MTVENLYKKFKWRVAKPTLKPNYMLIPVNSYKVNMKNVEKFNLIYTTIRKQNFSRLTRTNSNGICIKRNKLRLPCWDYEVKLDQRSQQVKEVELILLTEYGFTRIQLTNRDTEKGSGRSMFLKFIKILKKFNINIDDYAVDKEEGLKAKEEIKKDLIRLYRPQYARTVDQRPYENVHHLDYNSSFPAGLVNTHPEFKEAIEYIFEKRHENPVCKKILNYSIGYMQSEYIKYKYSTLSRDAKNDNYNRLLEMTKKLQDSGRIVLAYNTDGIWYQGDIYHDENEGKQLGQWKNDYVNCIYRPKSDGAYEFIENNKYIPVIRGKTNYEAIVPKEKWKWGDIYRSDVKLIQLKWDDEKGIDIHESII